MVTCEFTRPDVEILGKSNKLCRVVSRGQVPQQRPQLLRPAHDGGPSPIMSIQVWYQAHKTVECRPLPNIILQRYVEVDKTSVGISEKGHATWVA